MTFVMKEFTKNDEDSFYKALTDSVKASNLFRDVIITDSIEEAESTLGNVYMRIANNVASFWVDSEGRLNARFNTTISLQVKNKVYFSKVYDETAMQGLFGPKLKIVILKRIINNLLVDLSDLDFTDNH